MSDFYFPVKIYSQVLLTHFEFTHFQVPSSDRRVTFDLPPATSCGLMSIGGSHGNKSASTFKLTSMVKNSMSILLQFMNRKF